MIKEYRKIRKGDYWNNFEKMYKMAKSTPHADCQEKKTSIEALSQGKATYNLGKIKVPLSRDFYQASCGIGRFSRINLLSLNRKGTK